MVMLGDNVDDHWELIQPVAMDKGPALRSAKVIAP